MAVKKTSNGKKGGTLKGKRHYDKDGKPLGGIKAIVTDTKQIVELEGGEVIINREASKKHWKELSKINQSAGNGVPILPPDEVMADADEYKKGGRTIEFNPNNVPSKLIYNYAKKIKDQHPDVWALGSNAYNNEAFENLERVVKRGYWLPKENWFYVKWQTFGLRHKEDDKVERIIADLKWLNKVEKGFGYMKDVIDKYISDNNSTEMENGGNIKLENTTQYLNDNIKCYTKTYTLNTANITIDYCVGVFFKITKIGINKDQKRKGYASILINKAKENAKKLGFNKIDLFLPIDEKGYSKEYTKEDYNIAVSFYKKNGFVFYPNSTDKMYFNIAEMETGDNSSYRSPYTEDINIVRVFLLSDKYKIDYKGTPKEFIEKFKNIIPLEDLKEITNNDITKAHKKLNDMMPYNTGGSITIKLYPKKELVKGIDVEHEHDETLRKLYAHEITPKEAPKYIAMDHLEEDDHYYTKLAEIEGFKDGGKIATVMHEFKEGKLKSSSGQLVTDRKQALAIAISEQRRAEQKLELGGRVTCAKCGHKWLKANEDTHTCKVCNHDNEKRLDLIDNKHYVNIEKVEDMNKTEIFFNPDIFKSSGDYILGGFNAEELNGIIVAGDDFALSFPKLESIFEKRIERAIENFKNEIRANIIKSGRNVEDVDFEQEFYDEFNNLTETYLGETITSTSTEKIKDFIVNHSAYQTWSARIEKRVTAFRDKITQDASKVNDPKTSKVSVSDAVNLTYCSTLEEILEQLFNIVEDNTL